MLLFDLLKSYFHRFYSKESKFFGTELEFPVFSFDETPPHLSDLKNILKLIASELKFEITKHDDSMNVIEIKHPGTFDILKYDFTYGIIEWNSTVFGDLYKTAQNFYALFQKIQTILKTKNLYLGCVGVNPHIWALDLPVLESPRLGMIYHFQNKYTNNDNRYSHFNAFCCAAQTQIDVNSTELTPFVNLIHEISWVSALLFAHSPFIPNGSHGTNLCHRDNLWKNSAFGINPLNVGIPDTLFQNIDQLLLHESKKSIFHTLRDGKYIFFYPEKLEKYFEYSELQGYSINPDKSFKKTIFKPDVNDLEFFRSYTHCALSHRATVETRGDCAQPLDSLFAPAAFYFGLVEKREEISQWLISQKSTMNFAQELRNQACLHAFDMKCPLRLGTTQECVKSILKIVEQGLISRGKKEEIFLKPLFERLNKKTNPALMLLDDPKYLLSPQASFPKNNSFCENFL